MRVCTCSYSRSRCGWYHSRTKRSCPAHARSCESVKQCVRHGIDLIFHASFTDEEALDMLEANKERHFVAPGIAWLINTSYHAAEWGITPDIAKGMGYHRELEVAIESLKKMHKRGIRILRVASELRDRGIKLSVIIPGLVDTSLIPHNKRLDRALMIRPEDVATAVMTIVNAPAGVCPVELVLEPQRDPIRGGQ